jgi:hypothetical protein
MKKSISILVILFLTICTFAQSTYQSNSRYWKNRKPHAGYWQQDVHYTIDANIDETKHTISATEKLVYTNNSPDALPFVYFHLYQNAFVKDAYLEQLYNANLQEVAYGKQSGSGLGTVVKNMMVNGELCKTELDNTVLKVYLPQSLQPNQSVTFTMQFSTYWDVGTIRRRMQFYNSDGFMHYNGVHWYPRISVYDAKKGWDVDQHLNKELYGNFGAFDVNLTFANNYFVEATGALQNKSEVFPEDLWQKVQARNFLKKPWNEKPSVIVAYDKNKRKTWRYHADLVHDFAFTADPSYRYDVANFEGVECVAIVQEQHASKWQNAADYVAKIIETYGRDFGKYEYPKIVAADANDGMEYPMITLDGGADPGYRGLLAHEIGHNWFYGMIGNNETYRAALDEGFTQFATAWALQKIDGNYMVEEKDKRPYVAKNRTALQVWDRNVLNRYTYDAMRGDDKCLNTHSNDFNSALAHENGYGNVYHKTASMLLNLQYVLGDSLFLSAFQHYVEKWKFAHPYFEDFRTAIIEHTHVDLNWFFDQWLETTKTIDYSVENYKPIGGGQYQITLQRKGEMQMPIDITVNGKDGSSQSFHIPNTNWFVKNTKASVLPKWYGWDILNPNYTFTASVPSGVQSVQIDSSARMADVDMTNNYLRKTIFKNHSQMTDFDFGLRNPLSRRGLNISWRPDLWWNPIDGVKLGIHTETNYMNYQNKLVAEGWWNSGLFSHEKTKNPIANSKYRQLFDYNFVYQTPIKKISRKLFIDFVSRSIEGLQKNAIGFTWQLPKDRNVNLQFVNLYRHAGPQYHNYATEWSSFIEPMPNVKLLNVAQSSNDYAQISYQKKYSRFKSNGQIKVSMRANLPSSIAENTSYNYAYSQAELLHNTYYKKLVIRTRAIVRVGAGNSVPTESALYLAGANPEEMAENKYTRTSFACNSNWNQIQTDGFAHLQMGGGLNVRGFAGYLAVDEKNTNTYTNYKGRSGAGINAEIEFDRYIRFAPKQTRNWLRVNTYLFADAAGLSNSNIEVPNFTKLIPNAANGWGKMRADAGLGALFTIKHWGRFEKANPITIRVDWPLFVNSVPYNYSYDFFSARRWVFGVGRSF